MIPTSHLLVQTSTEGGVGPFTLRVAGLPGKRSSLAHDRTGAVSARLRIIEGEEYRYEWLGPACGPLVSEPQEVFQADEVSGRTGRLRPALLVGFLDVVVSTSGKELGRTEVEVRSRKLGFEDEYRWMLRDIAHYMTELLMERFAASELQFSQDASRDAVTLYQRFEFLRALIQSQSFRAGVQEILRRPHTDWIEHSELVHLGRGASANSSVARQLSKLGYRPGMPLANASGYVPAIERSRTEASHDTVPNRFVKFAFEQWRQVLGDIDSALGRIKPTPSILRGRKEVAAVLLELDEVLHHELFVEVGRLDRFPADNQVLQKREGYRDVFEGYVQFELAARLSWASDAASHSAGAHDIATLYEYWAFLQLAKCVASVAGAQFNLSPLLQVRGDGLAVDINKGKERVFSGLVFRAGREMKVELWFNRTFSVPEGSWTRRMRPDYSLVISALGVHGRDDPVVLHFDAKYRVEFAKELFGADEVDSDAGEEETRLPGGRMGAKREDLLKMHAYRDAIRRSAGAYVLYPGGDGEIGLNRFNEYHELLPGLGAFVLRPTEDGSPKGNLQLLAFVDAVVNHAARRLTEHERGRYWLEDAYSPWQLAGGASSVSGPPPNATVLLGFVKNAAHWKWIERTRSYNLRGAGREGGVAPDSTLLHSQLVLLYCPGLEKLALARVLSDPEQMSDVALLSTGYPEPGGKLYWVVQVGWVGQPSWLHSLTAGSIARFLSREGLVLGAPHMVSWDALLQAAG